MKLRSDDNLTPPRIEPQGVLVESAHQNNAVRRLTQTGQNRSAADL
jgi:hypothetical protein